MRVGSDARQLLAATDQNDPIPQPSRYLPVADERCIECETSAMRGGDCERGGDARAGTQDDAMRAGASRGGADFSSGAALSAARERVD